VLPASVPLAFGVNGFIMFHPDTSSAAAQADNGSWWHLQNFVDEAHIWAGGAFSEHIAYFAELTFGVDGSVDLEHAELHFNDLVPKAKHVLNLYVGRGTPTLTSFGPHSSYLADTMIPGLGVTALYGSPTDSFNLAGIYNLIELNGMVKGRFIYSLGMNSGANLDVRTTQNAYAHVGFKLGGMRLDGEGDTTGNPEKPWAETALTVDAWGYYSASHYTPAATAVVPGMTPPDQDDITWVAGTNVRGTVGSFTINSGFYYEWHSFATAMGFGVNAMSQYDELSYVVFPWLVPALRLEYASVAPTFGPRINLVKFIPGIDFLVRPNLKLGLIGQLEWADGAPDGGWAATGGSIAPAMGAATEFESIQLIVAYAF
jgi:hypothetical protein